MLLDSVRIRYTRGGAWVLDGVTLDLPAGTVTAVTGGNGSGKSTLLRLAAGLARPTTGTVRDRPARVGFVPERLSADMRMSARGYLTHMGRIQGVDPAAATQRGLDLLAQLLIEGDVDAPISTLSKGNAQKVALAQAMLTDKQLLVLDEPWSGLDAEAHQALVRCLERQRDAGAIVLLAEHRTGAVAASADAVYHLQHGRLTERRLDSAAPGSESGSETAFVVVVLRPGSGLGDESGSGSGSAAGSQEAAKLLGDLPGVRAIRRTASRVTLEVDGDHSDAVLAEALRSGYSVHEVRRVDAVTDIDTDTESERP